jgi:hypothetical protein
MKMGTENTEAQEDQSPPGETPLCLGCLRPVDPRAYYCPYCGEATGQLTPPLPFVNIPWQIRIWGQMWRQMWSREVSLPGRLLRLVMIVWLAPVLLLGGLFRPWRNTTREPEKEEADESPD